MNEDKTIYELDLHEIIRSPECTNADDFATTIMRVAGGWIYRTFDKSHNMMSMVFIPFDNEFQKPKKFIKGPRK